MIEQATSDLDVPCRPSCAISPMRWSVATSTVSWSFFVSTILPRATIPPLINPN